MNLRQHLLTLIESFAAAKDLSPSRVTTIVLGSGNMHRRLAEGKDINVGRLEEAVAWFDAHWPADAAWPEGLPRPSLILALSPARECAAAALQPPADAEAA